MPDGTAAPSKRGELAVQLIVPAFQGDPAETLIEGRFVANEGTCEHVVVDGCEVERCPAGATEVLAAPGKLHVGFPGGSEFGWLII